MNSQKKSPKRVPVTAKRSKRKSLAENPGTSKSTKSEDRFRQQPRDIEIPLVDDYEVQASESPRSKRESLLFGNVHLIFQDVSYYIFGQKLIKTDFFSLKL